MPYDNTYENADGWYAALQAIARKHGCLNNVRDKDGWIGDWQEESPETAFYSEFPELEEG